MKFKKPSFWDKKKQNIISFCLLPFTLPMLINNFFLNKKTNTKPQNIKTICVGNIYIGGTGKTPTSLKLFEIIKNLGFKCCIGKKFYPNHSDEEMILQKKSVLFSALNRKKIIENAQKDGHKFVVFDDGLQDKSVSYDLQFVCFDGEKFIGNGNLIPAGPLREKITSLKKYDGIFIKDNFQENTEISKIIKKINPDMEIFNTFFEILNLSDFDLSKNYLIFSGIGNPENFKRTLIENKFKVIHEIIYPDHYDYSEKDIKKIKNYAKVINANIITTEKDFIKISKIAGQDIKFLNVKLKIVDEKNFINFLKQKIL